MRRKIEGGNMTSFMIGPMCVTEDDFKHQLKKNGLKFGYIKRLYEKWKDNDLTYFRVIIEGCPFVICTDDENSYPEIEEETGKKIEEYSLEWLENLFYQSTFVGPISFESLSFRQNAFLNYLLLHYAVKAWYLPRSISFRNYHPAN